MSGDEADLAARSRLHPLTMLFEGIALARGFILPAVVGALTATSRNWDVVALWVGLIAGVPALVGAIAKYLHFRYVLADDVLVVDSGVLQKQHRVIPLASVQNLNIRATALQRLFGVATLTVETATGGTKADADFAVLGRAAAEELMNGILARRRRAAPEESAVGVLPVAPVEDSGTVITHLAAGELVIAGATANHAGLIVAATAGFLQFADDLPYLEWGERQFQRLPLDSVTSALLIGIAAFWILLLVGWIVSIVGSVVGYYDFTLTSRGQRLHKTYGLLARHATTVPLERVQAMRVEESILRRPLGLASLRVTTAGSAVNPAESRGAEIIAPIAPTSDVARFVRVVFPTLDYGEIALSPVHPKSRSRAFTLYMCVLLALAAAAAAWRAQLALIPLALVLPAWLLAAWQYRNRGYARVARHVVARSGVFNRITWLVPEHKVQTLHLRESPFQRRHGLATVQLDTPGQGRVASVYDVGYGDAVQLVNSLRHGLAPQPPSGDVRERRGGL